MIDARSSSGASRAVTGKLVVLAIVCLGVCLAAFALWYQRGQTRRCLDFYGSAIARRIQVAPRVELWRIDPTAAAGEPSASRRQDISHARGVVHLRRGLVEDASFAWDRPPPDTDSTPLALAFFDHPKNPHPDTVVILWLDAGGGSVAVAGRPGRIALGRIAAGLRGWLADVGGEWLEPDDAGSAAAAAPIYP